MKNLKIIKLSFAILLSTTTQVIGADVFSKGQKEGIEKVVEEFLLKKPEIMEKAFQKLQEKRQQEQASQNKSIISKNVDEIFTNSSDPFIGNSDGHKKLVVFMDPFCGHCRKFHKTLNMVPQDPELRDVKIIFKDLPIFGEISKLAVRSIFAAKNQGKYAEFQNAVFESNPDMTEQDIFDIAEKIGLDIDKFKVDLSSSIIEKKIAENETLASKLNIEATPTIIYGDVIIPGGPDINSLKKIFSLNPKDKN
ncbi:MAG: thioredoxin domain-containing protein [Candidatus Paracaedimonas acanthamoebae]|uniref:Thioredoxin domain-containing protein n=1 Tax=Candidatus Paracaedimonas acanthamoebae TaxID=244581 RepID=A0A8J7PR19_9PROT|nr:thioredoxin domain-containing protein [Candidatus Paracaedimonas acanthamoebae]